MKTIASLLILLGIIVGTFSCHKSNLEDYDLNLGYEYYPLEIGQSRLYAVDSIIFDPSQSGTSMDTLSGFFREDIVDTLRDNSGALVFRIERYYRKHDAAPWQIHSVVSMSRGTQQAVFIENNLRFIKLLFPLKTDLEWDANAHFSATTEWIIAGETLEFFKGWKSTVLEKQAQYQVGSQTYQDVYIVQLADFKNKIEYRYGLEAYAPDQGLIYQEIWVLDTQCQICCNRDLGACDLLSWEEKAEKGLILKKRLLQ